MDVAVSSAEQHLGWRLWLLLLGVLLLSTPCLAQPLVPISLADQRAKAVTQVVLGILSYARWPTEPTQLQLCVIGPTEYTDDLLTAESGDVLLVESVDRLSRLSQADWDTLKATIKDKGLRLVIADLPTSHMLVKDTGITGQIMDVINDMLIELMATMARLDQDKRVERIKQGLENKRVADPDWKPAGKGRNAAKWAKVQSLLLEHPTMNADDIAKLADCGVATVYRIKRETSVQACSTITATKAYKQWVSLW